MTAFKLPELGENIETAEVTRLLVAEGDTVAAGQNVMELDSEKASFPLPSPSAGKIMKLHVKEGDSIKVGQTILDIEEEKAEAKPEKKTEEKPAQLKETQPQAEKKKPAPERRKAPRKKAEPAQPAGAPAEPEAPQETAVEKPAKVPAKDLPARPQRPPVPAGPATRKLARELGVELRQVKGSGPVGRITRDDVKAYVQQRLKSDAGSRQPPLPDFSRWGPIKRQRQSALARASASRLCLAWQQVPHVTQHELADITDLEAARRKYNEENRASKPNITVTVLCIHAVVAALKAFPQFNSSLDAASGELILKDYHHIGVAVDTEQGLLVPVLRDADRKSMVELAAELVELADKARKRSLAPSQMEGGTFTISNLGGIGGTAFTPIVNYPEVAILGIARARHHQVADDGQFVERLLLPLSLSYDHRVINGADGARFIVKIAELLSAPFPLLAES